jgi:hypothetical protein
MNIRKYYRLIHWLGAFLLVGGALDPLEGAFVILIGSLLITLSFYLNQNVIWRKMIIANLMLLMGIVMMFIISALGGIGGRSQHSIWLGLLILPYPIGWIYSIALLIRQVIEKRKSNK